MPAPASEDDLKRRARRRLIGAVALMLVAVIVLPLLLESEPPPSGRLNVKMPALAAQPTLRAVQPVSVVASTPPAEPAPEVANEPDGVPQETPDTVPAGDAEATPPAVSAKVAAKPVHTGKKPVDAETAKIEPGPVGHEFVVQLGACSDAEKGSALKARALMLGLPGYTDKAGALTRVRIGPFASHEAAEKAATRLAASGMKGRVVAK
jgi:DedD protein